MPTPVPYSKVPLHLLSIHLILPSSCLSSRVGGVNKSKIRL
nr:MAG TPA: hypothetical protein [Caudoviricetes sp.]